MQENEIGPLSSAMHKNQLKCIKDLNVRLLGKNETKQNIG
jgi:hypothetical protein